MTNYFLAVPLANHSALAAIVNELLGRGFGVGQKWLHPKDWHLTLYFFGSNNPQAMLDEKWHAKKMKEFYIRSQKINVFHLKRQDIIMVDCDQDEVQLWYQELCSNFSLEPKRFHPHVTLLRQHKKLAPPPPISLTDQLSKTCFEIALFESRPNQEHKYHIIKTYNLEK